METKILVIGIGGAGCSVVDKVALSIKDYDYINNIRLVATNTDRQNLINMKAVEETITLGKGRGAGSDPERGKRLAEEAINSGAFDKLAFDEEITYDLIIAVAGLGGGTGTGAGPVVLSHLKRLFEDSTVLSVLILPDKDEYGQKSEIVNRGLVEFYHVSDAITIIDNAEVVDLSKPIAEAYDGANEFIKNLIVTILDICERYGNPNIDFADVENVFLKSNQSSKFVFIGSLEFPTPPETSDIPQKLSVMKKQTAVTSFRGANNLLIGFFHSGKLSAEKSRDITELIKSEIVQGGKPPYIKRGDYIFPDMKSQVKIGLVIGGVQVDPRIWKPIKEGLEVNKLLKGVLDEGNS